MNRSLLASASALLFVSACATSTQSAAPAQEDPTSNYARAMGTVSALVQGGNEQIAIDRLTQLLGDPGMSDAQMAQALWRRAQLRYGDGSDVNGAVEDLNEILADYPESSPADDADDMLGKATAEQAALNARLEAGSLSPMERFRILFRLGEHQEASDLMLASAIQPENRYLVDMYQIGYLCDGEELAGPVFQLTAPDGAVRDVQFCSLGK